MSQAGYSPWGHKESDKTEHTCRHKLFTANICPRGCVSACFSNTCNFFLLYLLLRMTIFYHLQGSLVLHISLKVRQQECLLAQGVIVQDTVCVLLGGVFSVWRAPQTRSTPKKRWADREYPESRGRSGDPALHPRMHLKTPVVLCLSTFLLLPSPSLASLSAQPSSPESQLQLDRAPERPQITLTVELDARRKSVVVLSTSLTSAAWWIQDTDKPVFYWGGWPLLS